MTLTRSGDEIAAYFAEAMADLVAGESPLASDGSPLVPRFNVSPQQEVLNLVTSERGSEGLGCYAWKRWGLVPGWCRDAETARRMSARTFNARAETVAEKPSFRTAFKRRRSLVLADGFYEWTPKNRDHRPYHFRPIAEPLMLMAGLHESWRGEGGEVLETCTVLTTEASADLEGVHHRMPVLLDGAGARAWLDPATSTEALHRWLRPAPAGTLGRRAVSRAVNDARRDDPNCLADAEDTIERDPRPVGTKRRKPDQPELFPTSDRSSTAKPNEGGSA